MPKQTLKAVEETTLEVTDTKSTKRFNAKQIALAAIAAVLIPLAAVGTRTLFAGYKLKEDDTVADFEALPEA